MLIFAIYMLAAEKHRGTVSKALTSFAAVTVC
jgi:hypothetical protein